jgi:succinate-semialdehyde dehydrogenase/glutarate-semialdehyde dehydrogenase
MSFRSEKMLIDGVWRDAQGGEVVEILDPATEEIVGSVPLATAADLDEALSAAERGWRLWRKVSAWERSAVLRRAAAILTDRRSAAARTLSIEQGKPLREAEAELEATIEQLEWFADEARRIYGRTVDARNLNQRYQVRREPIGPVAAFTPWNFPVLLAARKVAPALAAGCSVILKPAEEAPTAAIELARALVDAGLPNGVLNVVTGRPSSISEHLLRSPIIRKLSFTGSVAVGRHLLSLAATNIVNVSMELGGHAPVLVFGDVDGAVAGRECAKGKFRNCGQVCISPTRFYVHESIIQDFTRSFVDTVREFRVGRGTDPETDIGPLASARRVEAIESLVDDAVAKGARIEVGGKRMEGPGYFYQPTVLSDVPPDAELMWNEPFGPVAPIVSFSDFDEVIKLANETQFGLAGYVLSENLTTVIKASEELEVGIVGVNSFAVSAAPIPFGGVKASGIGSENGTEAIESYLHPKAIVTGLGLS